MTGALRSVAAVGVVVALLAPTDAHAKPRKISKAKKRKKVVAVVQNYVELGESLFRAENHLEAAENFIRAEATLRKADMPVPVILYRSIARCYDQIGEFEKALTYFDRFLESADPENPVLARAIKEAENDRQRLLRLLERTAISFQITPQEATVSVDDDLLGSVPTEPVKVKPGKHRITLEAKGFEALSMEVDAVAGATVPVVARLVSTAPSPKEETPAKPVAVAPPKDPGAGAGWLPWALALGGGAASLGAIWMQYEALDANDRADRANEAGDKDEVDKLHGKAVTRQFVALGLGVAFLGMLGGATWLWVGPSEVRVHGTF